MRTLWAARAEQLGKQHDEWHAHVKAWLAANPDKADSYHAHAERRVPADLLAQLAAAAPKELDATRSLAGTILQKAAALVPSLVGGDADLGGSTKTPLKDSPKVAAGKFEGKNLRFGIREHAMGSLANGMALYGMFVPFTATFLTFSDYMRPAIRLAALSHTHVVHVFTHDSVFLGEDGPTHQSVEHTAALRLIPGVDVWRPADGAECAAAWASALTRKDGPTELVLTRQKVGTLVGATGGGPTDAARGAYVLVKEQGGAPEVTLFATGSELALACEAAAELGKDGRRVRVVSMPCWEVFARQDADYRASVLPASGKRVGIEAGKSDLWARWIGSDGL
ncbi:MAG TPA: transketolase C-terminal domain-containing protein, partial [Gemmatimonadales bacterium]|nr:transketolase C-terminal domain-containing protein [Gemmatimonadales bacterium]